MSLTAVFVIAGFILGDGVTGVLHFDPRSPFVSELATVALIVILFRDGLEVDGELLQSHWQLPLRKLVLAMPLTAVIVAAGTQLLTGLSWTESFLVGALLSPTDPVLSSSVVTNPRVPRGGPPLAQPRVGAQRRAGAAGGAGLQRRAGGGRRPLRVVAVRDREHRARLRRRASRWASPPRGWRRRDVRPRGRHPGPSALAVRAGHRVCRPTGVAVLTPHGNGLIAVYVGGDRRSASAAPTSARYFERQAADLVEMVKLGIFVVFGLAAHAARPVRLRLGGGRRRGRHPAGGAAGGGVRARWPAPAPTRRRGRSCLVRPQGRGHDDVLTARARPADRRRRDDLQPRRADRVLLDPRPRRDRHGRARSGWRGARRRAAATLSGAVADVG